MFARLSVLTVVLIGLAGLANAQAKEQVATHEQGSPSMTTMHEHSGSARHQVAITDEYGFKYDAQGNRLDANGYVVAPPHTLPGAKVLR